jgi:biotin operon repressor
VAGPSASARRHRLAVQRERREAFKRHLAARAMVCTCQRPRGLTRRNRVPDATGGRRERSPVHPLRGRAGPAGDRPRARPDRPRDSLGDRGPPQPAHGESFAAQAKIARSLYRVSARTVRRRLPRLRDRGLLVEERRHDQRGYRRPSGIRLNVPPRSDLPATGGQEDDLPATPGHKDRLPATGTRRRRAYRPNATRLPATGGRSYRPRVAAQNKT